MVLREYKRTIKVDNLDTGKHDLNIEKWTTGENNVYAYICKDISGKVIGTKCFMEHVKINEITHKFRKDIREKRIILK
jgi:hypothetical protein